MMILFLKTRIVKAAFAQDYELNVEGQKPLFFVVSGQNDRDIFDMAVKYGLYCFGTIIDLRIANE
ncbi:hypothetical protein [Sinomicrobium sp. M5D2P9]